MLPTLRATIAASISGKGLQMASREPDIRPLSTRVVYENRWMRVREDQIERRSGARGIYGVVEKPDFVVVVPVDEGRVYLVEQYRYPLGERFWEFPQGSWETRPDIEAHVVAAAELREETGLVAGSMQHAGHLLLASGYSSQGYHIYLASQLAAGVDEREPEEEDLVVRAFSLAEVERMICAGVIRDATTVAALGLLKLKGMIG